MKRFLAIAILASVTSHSMAQTILSDEQVAAIALPEPQLRNMLGLTVVKTQTMPVTMYALGVPAACAIIKPAFEAAIASILPRWRTNLVKAYRDNIPADKLSEAVRGPLLASGITLQPYLPAVGEAMQKDSQPLLIEALKAVLTQAAEAAAKIDRSKIDKQQRMAELKQAAADGTLFCGLAPTGAAL